MKTMRILGIETSCDDTALALVEASGNFEHPRFHVLKNTISSQLDVHKEYGGIVPSLAKRAHSHNLIKVFYKTLSLDYGISNSISETQNNQKPTAPKVREQLPKSKIQNIEQILERYPDLLKEFKEKIIPIEKPNIDLIAVTQGPGLEPALWVGINFARALSHLWDIPILGIDHMEGHIAVILLSKNNKISKSRTQNKIQFPTVALAVSGGHTQLILVKKWLEYELLGETVDDAAGEAFDKVARMLGLSFPGGPEIEKLSQKGNPEAFDFPRPMIRSKDYNFSFSGLKTAVRYTIESMTQYEVEKQKEDIAASFQKAVIDSITAKTIKAAQDYGAKTVILAGGVAANSALKTQMREKLKKELPETLFIVPEIKLATDNGVMIAVAGYLRWTNEEKSDWKKMTAQSGKLITEKF